MYPDYEDDVEVLNDQALRTLVENHREEYEELLAQTQSARIAQLEDDIRRKQATIEALRRNLAKANEDKERWRARLTKNGLERA